MGAGMGMGMGMGILTQTWIIYDERDWVSVDAVLLVGPFVLLKIAPVARSNQTVCWRGLR